MLTLTVYSKCRKLLTHHLFFGIGFVKSQVNGVAYQLVRVAPMYPSVSIFNLAIPCVADMIINEMR